MAVSPPTKAGVASAAAAIAGSIPFTPHNPHTFGTSPSPAGAGSATPASSVGSSISATLQESRRPSPWHEIAHSLSTARGSLGSGHGYTAASPHSALTSAALREWDRQLAGADAVRHTLLPSGGSPKLSAERDRDGHVEYKLKLIDPSPERFEKLVTQMMWRLKQGRNEAIYELGLADDGAVIGLTRAEMDASLSTLERMASEVGATVLVLKEIVLTDGSSASSTASSTSASASGTGTSVRSGSWVARRPDLDALGRPRKGTKVLADMDFVPPLSLDEAPKAEKPAPVRNEAKAATKRRKAAERREARRLDLLRGDGTSAFALSSGASASPSPGNSRPGSRLDSGFFGGDDSPDTGDGTPDDTFVDGLRIPLDSLSLSFADVIDDQPDSCEHAETELICVEALVVRKSALDEEYYGEEDSWGFGED